MKHLRWQWYAPLGFLVSSSPKKWLGWVVTPGQFNGLSLTFFSSSSPPFINVSHWKDCHRKGHSLWSKSSTLPNILDTNAAHSSNDANAWMSNSTFKAFSADSANQWVHADKRALIYIDSSSVDHSDILQYENKTYQLFDSDKTIILSIITRRISNFVPYRIVQVN